MSEEWKVHSLWLCQKCLRLRRLGWIAGASLLTHTLHLALNQDRVATSLPTCTSDLWSAHSQPLFHFLTCRISSCVFRYLPALRTHPLQPLGRNFAFSSSIARPVVWALSSPDGRTWERRRGQHAPSWTWLKHQSYTCQNSSLVVPLSPCFSRSLRLVPTCAQ